MRIYTMHQFRRAFEDEACRLESVAPLLNHEGRLRLSACGKIADMMAYNPSAAELCQLIDLEWRRGSISLEELRTVYPALQTLDRMARMEQRRGRSTALPNGRRVFA